MENEIQKSINKLKENTGPFLITFLRQNDIILFFLMKNNKLFIKLKEKKINTLSEGTRILIVNREGELETRDSKLGKIEKKEGLKLFISPNEKIFYDKKKKILGVVVELGKLMEGIEILTEFIPLAEKNCIHLDGIELEDFEHTIYKNFYDFLPLASDFLKENDMKENPETEKNKDNIYLKNFTSLQKNLSTKKEYGQRVPLAKKESDYKNTNTSNRSETNSKKSVMNKNIAYQKENFTNYGKNENFSK